MSKLTQQDKLIQLVSANTIEPFTVGLLESKERISHSVSCIFHYVMIGKYTTVEDIYISYFFKSDNLQFYYWGILTDRDRAIFNRLASKEIRDYLKA